MNEDLKKESGKLFNMLFNIIGDDNKMPGGTSGQIKDVMNSAIDRATLAERKRCIDIANDMSVDGGFDQKQTAHIISQRIEDKKKSYGAAIEKGEAV